MMRGSKLRDLNSEFCLLHLETEMTRTQQFGLLVLLTALVLYVFIRLL